MFEEGAVKEYARAEELTETRHRHERGDPIQARGVMLSEKLWRRYGRNPAHAGALGTVVLAVL